MAHTEQTREETIAMIFLDTWGSTSYPPTEWKGFRWSEDGAPEWLESSALDGHDSEACVRVLSLDSSKAPEGWEEIYRYQCGEKECPDCNRRKDDQPEEYEGQPKQSECTLCEGSGVVYWGEEWEVIVFAPAYVYGSGMFGCLYDYGPNRCSDRAEAIDSFLQLFGDSLQEGEEEELRAALANGGRYDFKDPGEVGADYCECS